MSNNTNGGDTFLSLLKFIGSSGSIFGAFLYYVGRQYTEAYYNALGIPSKFLEYSFADYMYFGIRSWIFLIAIAITFLLIAFWRFYRAAFSRPIIDSKPDEKKGKKFKENLKDIFDKLGHWIPIAFFFYWILAALLVLFWVIPSSHKNPWTPLDLLISSGIVIMVLFGAIWFASLLITDKSSSQFMQQRRYLAISFLAALLFTSIASAQSLPYACGTFAGIMDISPKRAEQVFPKVQLIANKQIGPPDINWNKISQDYLEAKGSFLLLLPTNSRLFLRTKPDSNTFSIPTTDIVNFYIQIPGQSDNTTSLIKHY